MTKTLIIYRGLPGSGKSTAARRLLDHPEGSPAIHVESDMFFVGHDGVYRFNRFQREDAHKWCLQVAITAMENSVPRVIVSNVFCRLWSMEPYIRAAKAEGYGVCIHTLPHREPEWHHEHNTHGVPLGAIRAMWNSFQTMPPCQSPEAGRVYAALYRSGTKDNRKEPS